MRHPLILIRSLAGQVHLGRRLDVEEHVQLVLDAKPGRAERINRLAAGEAEADRLHLAGKNAVRLFPHSRRVALDQREAPLLLHVSIENIPAGGGIVMVVLQPGYQFVGLLRGNDLVTPRADDALRPAP